MSNWSVKDSVELYGVDSWGKGYFDVNDRGNITVNPPGSENANLDLLELTEDLTERGIRTPILIRFPDIVKSRVDLLNGSFDAAINEYGYKGTYQGVYPIKVNQQRHLVEEILRVGSSHHIGLECGSKPELLVGLAMVNDPQSLIICNGFKDVEYVETAMLSQKLDKNTLIVVDRFSELPLILNLAQKLNTRPKIGFRVKLSSKGAGKWVESSGNRSKFGLTAAEIVEGVRLLNKLDMIDCLKLLHFHIGSQITSIHSIKDSLKEGARVYTELVRLGAPLEYIDVGGGLGVDYDGSGDSNSSVNYSVQEYANDVVSIIQETCDSKEVAHPIIVSESGRALVAHQSMLVFNVLGVDNTHRKHQLAKIEKIDHQIIHNLYEIHENLNCENLHESYNDTVNFREDVSNLFNYGVLSLEQLAKAENLIWANTAKMETLAAKCDDCDDLLDELKKLLSNTYFGNFSVFQSLPDSWAVGQVFPVMPIHRLCEKPTRQATIVDLTCDSDGKIEKFLDVETGDFKKTLEVHELNYQENYYLGVFLVGAYQEILGDLHNLFGDTDAVHIKMTESGYTVEHVVQGDSVGEVLGYLEYQRQELVEKVRRMSEEGIAKGSLSKSDARLLMRHYEDGLSGYTYLEDFE